MKNIIFLLFTVALLACKKDKDPEPAADTAIAFTIVDINGTPVPGAKVSLYENQTDLITGAGDVTTVTADRAGKARITGLQSIKYAFLIEKNCLTNFNGGVQVENPITKNSTTDVTAVLQESGTLSFTNTTDKIADVYIDSVFYNSVPAGQVLYRYRAPIGFKTIRIVTMDIDNTYTGTLTCGATLNTTF